MTSFLDQLEPSCFVGFVFLLPEAVPIPPQATWYVPVDEDAPEFDATLVLPFETPPPHTLAYGKNFVFLRFWQLVDDSKIPMHHEAELLSNAFDGIKPVEGEEAPELEIPTDGSEARYRTVVEATTLSSTGSAGEVSIFLRCSDALLDFYRSYRAVAPKPLPELTLNRIFPMVMTYRRGLTETEVEFVGTTLIEGVFPNFGAPISEIGRNNFDQVAGVHARLNKHDPAVRYMESRAEAGYHLLVTGSYRNAVIHLGIACEVLLDGLLGMLMWEEGLTPTVAAQVFKKFVVARVKADYNVRLGGTWKIDSGAVGSWHTDVATLRNRVVHAGYLPSEDEAFRAERASDALRDFTARRLEAKSAKYPYTAVTFFGEEEIPGLPKLSAAAKKWVEENKDRLDTLQDEHMAWRIELNMEVEKVRS